MFSLTTTPISREDLVNELKSDQAGGLCVFEGWVRDHNQGKKVSSLEYQVYEAMALKEGEKILIEAKQKFNLHHIVCSHRYGHLLIGDTAVWIGASATHRDDAFKATRFVIDEIKLRLPVWKKEHYVSEKPEWVFCKDHHTHVHFTEAEYYQKQEKLTDQNKLKEARVLVIGAGGLGCPVLMNLTNAGVGHIDLVDFDTVSISNLHRQPLYSTDSVGEKKVVIAKNKLKLMNPFVHLHAFDLRVDAGNIEKLIGKNTLVIDCTDNMETKFLLHDACMKMRVPLVSASIYQFEGQVRTFVPGTTGCLRCTHDHTPDDSKLGNCNDFGVLGANVMAIGALEASEALQFLMNGSNQTMESTFFMNTRSLSQMKIKNLKKENCKTCAGDVVLETNDFEVDHAALTSQEFIFVDVRDQEDSVLEIYKTSDKKIVIGCHRGVRSKSLVKSLRAEGHQHFFSLKGGVKAKPSLQACGHHH